MKNKDAMRSSRNFKKALAEGKLGEAFVLAASQAVELKITTTIVSAEDDGHQQAQNCLETRVNLMQGEIHNEVDRDCIHSGIYQAVQKFHLEQVQRSSQIIQNNLNSIYKIFQALATLRQTKLQISDRDLSILQPQNSVSAIAQLEPSNKAYTELETSLEPISLSPENSHQLAERESIVPEVAVEAEDFISENSNRLIPVGQTGDDKAISRLSKSKSTSSETFNRDTLTSKPQKVARVEPNPQIESDLAANIQAYIDPSASLTDEDWADLIEDSSFYEPIEIEDIDEELASSQLEEKKQLNFDTLEVAAEGISSPTEIANSPRSQLEEKEQLNFDTLEVAADGIIVPLNVSSSSNNKEKEESSFAIEKSNGDELEELSLERGSSSTPNSFNYAEEDWDDLLNEGRDRSKQIPELDFSADISLSREREDWEDLIEQPSEEINSLELDMNTQENEM